MQILRRELNQEYLTFNSQMDFSHLSWTLQISCCDPAGYTLVKDAALIEINQAWSLLLPWQLYSGLLSLSIGWHLVALGSDWFKCVKVDNYSANINHEQWAVTMRVWRENFIQLKARKLLSGLSIPKFFSAERIAAQIILMKSDVLLLWWICCSISVIQCQLCHLSKLEDKLSLVTSQLCLTLLASLSGNITVSFLSGPEFRTIFGTDLKRIK